MIGLRTALILYMSLVVASFLTLKGPPRYFALLVVLLLVAKSVLHFYRQQDNERDS